MSNGIWFNTPDLEKMNSRGQDTMSEVLGIELTEFGPDYLMGRMPIDHRTIQPYGIMHGGASCALAETVGSIAANGCVDPKTHVCVGLDINTSHLRMVKTGYVTATARAIHIGKKTHVWEIKSYDDSNALVSWTRLTMAVLDRQH